jgi:hypothetical protein
VIASVFAPLCFFHVYFADGFPARSSASYNKCFRYIVERIWGAEIKEDKTEKDFEFDKKRKKITITQRVPFPAGSFYEGQDKKTEEMTFMLFLNSAESSRICVYESGVYFFAPPPLSPLLFFCSFLATALCLLFFCNCILTCSVVQDDALTRVACA